MASWAIAVQWPHSFRRMFTLIFFSLSFSFTVSYCRALWQNICDAACNALFWHTRIFPLLSRIDDLWPKFSPQNVFDEVGQNVSCNVHQKLFFIRRQFIELAKLFVMRLEIVCQHVELSFTQSKCWMTYWDAWIFVWHTIHWQIKPHPLPNKAFKCIQTALKFAWCRINHFIETWSICFTPSKKAIINTTKWFTSFEACESRLNNVISIAHPKQCIG